MVYGPALPPGGLSSARRGLGSPAAEADGLHPAKRPCREASASNGGGRGGGGGEEEYELTNEWPLEAARSGCGLHNLGNSCYLNSVLQCLTHLPPVAALAFSKYHIASCRLGGLDSCVFCILSARIRMSLKPRQSPDPPRRLWNRLSMLGRQFEQGRQEDAHELLRCLVDACERDLLKHAGRYLPNKHIPNPNTAVNALFQGTLRSQVKCGACGHESNTYDPFMDLSLDLPAVHSLTGALQRFTAPEHLDAANRYRCDACKGLVPARKQITIHHPPNCLVIHLKRFDPSGFGAKITRHIQFPETLPLHAYLSHSPPSAHAPHPPHAPHPAAPRAHPPTRSHPAAPDAHYTLHGVLVHQGFSSHSGHYFAFVRSGDARASWYCMNDSLVSPASLDTVKSQQAYILFYVASHMHALPPTPPATPTPTAPPAAPLPRPSSPASSTASAPIGPAPRPSAPAPTNGARAPCGPHLLTPSTTAPAPGSSQPPAPTRPPDNAYTTPHPLRHPTSTTHANGTTAPPSSPPGSPAPHTRNGNGNSAHHASAAGSSAPTPTPTPRTTHFGPPQRRPLTKQGIAQQRVGGVGEGPPLVKPVIPAAVLRLTQLQQERQQQQEEEGAGPEGGEPDAGAAAAEAAGGAGGDRAEGGRGEGRGPQENGHANGNGHGNQHGNGHSHGNGNGHEQHPPEAAHAGTRGTSAAGGSPPAAATPAAAAAGGPGSSGAQQREGQQQGAGAAGGAADEAAGGSGGSSGGVARKRRVADVDLRQEPTAEEGRRAVKQKLLGSIRRSPYLDLLRQHFRRSAEAGLSQEAAIQAAQKDLRRRIPREVSKEGVDLLGVVLNRAMDEALSR